MANQMQSTYDVVIIGSGFGGAINACRLAQAGRSVCVLERGKRWGKADFPRTNSQLARAFWNPKDLGLLDYRVFRRVDVIAGVGVGGGSLVYFNVNRQPPASIFENPRWPRAIKKDMLQPYYEMSREMLEAKAMVPPDGRDFPLRKKAFFDAVEGSGRDPILMNIAVYTGPERANPYSGITQDGCVYCGNCMLGCHVHAKNTLDLNYIPVAEKNGAHVFSLREVERIEPIEPVEQNGYRVHFKVSGSTDGERGSVVGKKLIVSAGTLGTNELLLRARDVHKTLPRLSPALGKGFSINGDLLLDGTDKANRVIDPVPGPGITSGVDCGTGENEIWISDMGYPDAFIWFLEGTLPTIPRLKNSFAAARAYLSRTFGFSKPWDYTRELNRFFAGSASAHYLPYLGMGTDAGNGTLRLSGGNLEVDWTHRESRKMYQQMEDALVEFSKALGGRYSKSFYWRWPLRKRFTAHPLGGCHLSDDPAKGVANEWGEVWNYPNLYVSDGSMVPTAVSVGPSATIAALSERIAEHTVKS
jgi:cholesterol oxidase